jgi:simple sugar transport system ATP-binding protein
VTATLELRGISKRFGFLAALRSVDLTVEPGEIHALLGENGAGKSTLVKCAFGLVRPDTGTISVAGRPVRIRDPRDARRLGLGMVHQHFTSIPTFTVLENLALTARWPLNPSIGRARLALLSQRTGLELDPQARVEELSAGQKQRLEVLSALATDATVLLLDEPSSVLSPPEAETFLKLVRGLCDGGVSSVLITHKLSEALAVADRVTVLRRGELVHSGPVAGQTAASLAALMLGEAPRPPRPRPAPQVGEIRVELTALSVPRLGFSGPGLHEATFEARAGEIVGIAAVDGNGQREFLRVIAGLVKPSHGSLQVSRPVSFIPEDRTTEGLIGELSLAENLVLARGHSAPWVRGPWLDWEAAKDRTRQLIEAFGVTAVGPDALAASLSGGNQQRLVVAAALERRPQVIVAENPTRGLDLRATAEVHDRLRSAARSGVAVVVHLADLDELLGLADRIAVLRGGALTQLPRGAERDQIGRRMLEGESS